ncbi:hypothetical protein OAJ77_04515 [Rhodospirillales bacterium]|nr:hypothetical protein [Rhodospirillales bacterium]
MSADKYVGDWKDGKYHGQGTKTYSNVDINTSVSGGMTIGMDKVSIPMPMERLRRSNGKIMS